jgi:hypothetical protein
MRVSVILLWSRLSVADKIAKARSIVDAMMGNERFPTPSPTLEAITGQAKNLEDAALAADGGDLESRANMHAQEELLDFSMKALGAYVENVANLDPLNAETIVHSANMSIKSRPVRAPKEFDVKATQVPGQVKLAVRGVSRGAVIFQMTTNPNDESLWTNVSLSTYARALVNDLVSGTRYFFRAAVINKNGQNPWTVTKNLVIQ